MNYSFAISFSYNIVIIDDVHILCSWLVALEIVS